MPHSVPLRDSHMEEPDEEILVDAPQPNGEVQSPEQASAAIDNPQPVTTNADVNIEDVFDDNDDDQDDEFPESSDTLNAQQSPPAVRARQVDPETISVYYQRFFPYKHLFQWLNHGVKSSLDFRHREFAFELQNEAYLRYQSYNEADEFHKELLRLNPARFEIGPVYNLNPRVRKALPNGAVFKPVSKELVFDIDLTDYDDIRLCCSKANICLKCWTFVTMAIKVIDTGLREDFGFDHILWVYSGRRGAHAWVCDERARSLPDDRRRAIANYFEIVRGGSQSGKRVNIKRPLHPHISRSLETLKPYFASTILTDQDTFSTTDQASRLLDLLPDKNLRAGLQRKWDSAPDRSSSNKWADIDTVAKTVSRGLDTKALLEAKQDIVLEYTYPRLDAEVSKKLIHLLKSPFVVHPGTGRVCVPIDIRNVDDFNPLETPTLVQLLDELNTWSPDKASQTREGDPDSDSAGGNRVDATKRNLHDYEKTSLKPYIEYFRSFVAALNKSERKRKRDDGEGQTETMEF